VAFLQHCVSEHVLHSMFCRVLLQHVSCCTCGVVSAAPACACDTGVAVYVFAVVCMFDHPQVQCECLNLVYSCDATVNVGCRLSSQVMHRTLQHASQPQRSTDKL
jgi:hypothetical protein